MAVVALRTLFLYVLIVASIRFMGKRQIGEFQPTELVVTILVSNIASLPIEDTNIPLLVGAIPILIVVCLEIILTALSLSSKKIRKLITGSPRMIIRDGQIDQAAMRALRFSIDDLLEELRSQGIFDIREVLFAVVETNGKVSVYQKFGSRTITPQIMQIKGNDDSGIPQVVVSDGKPIVDTLTHFNKTMKWLNKTVTKQGLQIQDVFLMTLDEKGDFYIIKKEAKA